MKLLSVTLALFAVLALVQPARQLDFPGTLLGIVVLLCAATTFRSRAISSFLKIFVGIFSTETIVFGLAVSAGRVLLRRSWAILRPGTGVLNSSDFILRMDDG